jgi:hypothetical protein
MLACKKIDKTMNYISRFGVHRKIEGKQSYGITHCGSRDNIDGHMGSQCCWGGNTSIHRSASASDGRCTTKGDGLEKDESKAITKKYT